VHASWIAAFPFTLLLLWPSSLSAADCPTSADVIATDRPDTTNSSFVIPYGSLQAENGVNWANRHGTQVLDGSETRVRLGIARCGEVLVDVPNYFATLSGLTPSAREFGSKGDLFVEYIGEYLDHTQSSQVVDVGGGWHVTLRQQLDFHIGVGFTQSSPSQYVGVGYSFRFDHLLRDRTTTPTR
jgi:hypothetical protein